MLMQNHIVGFGVSGANTAVNAVDFDGSNDGLSRGAGFTGAADSRTGIISFWFRLDGGDGSEQAIFRSSDGGVNIYRNTTNRFHIFLGGGGTFEFRTTNTYTASATWRHFLASWSTNAAAGAKTSHLYIDGSSDKTVVSDGSAAFDIDYTKADWGVGFNPGAGTNKFDGCLAEVYCAFGQFLDFSNSANRDKFRSAAGKPLSSLGTDGSTPTGSAPTVYLNNPAPSFQTNKGTGGNLTVTGSLDVASTSPSD